MTLKTSNSSFSLIPIVVHDSGMTQGQLRLEFSSLKVPDLELLGPKVPSLCKLPFGFRKLACVSFLVSACLCQLTQGPLNIWTEHSNCQIHSRGDSKTLIALLIPNIFLIFFMKLFFYAYKSWGHDPIWYFSCLCRKFSELRALLFLSSTQTSQNLKFIQKCSRSLKNKFQFWPLIKKILILTF